MIISNLIQVQKAVGKVHPDPPAGRVHFEADGLHEGDEDLPAVTVDDQQVPRPRREKPPDGPDGAPVAGDDLAPDDLEVVEAPLAGRGEILLGDVEVAPGQRVGPVERCDAPEPQDGGIPVEGQRFDLERLSTPPPVNEYPRKKKGPGTPPGTASA